MEVQHEADRRRFVAQVEGGEAELTYAEPRAGILDLQHTFVPPASRHRGVGGALAAYAFQYAREEGQRVVPTCSFVKRWISEHPDQQDLVADPT